MEAEPRCRRRYYDRSRSTSPHSRSVSLRPRSADRTSSARKGWPGHLLKIAALVAQAKRNSEFLEDSDFALKIFREAYAITKPWFVRIKKELIQHGVDGGTHAGTLRGINRGSKTGFLALLTKVAAMGWRASQSREIETDGISWKLKMLQEMHQLLTAHLEDTATEIQRLESRLGIQHHGSGISSGRLRGKVQEERPSGATIHPVEDVTHSRGLSDASPPPSQQRRTRQRERSGDHEISVYEGPNRQVGGAEPHDVASLAGSMHLKAPTRSHRSEVGSQRSVGSVSTSTRRFLPSSPAGTHLLPIPEPFPGLYTPSPLAVHQPSFPNEQASMQMPPPPNSSKSKAQPSVTAPYQNTYQGNPGNVDISQYPAHLPVEPEQPPHIHTTMNSFGWQLAPGQPPSMPCAKSVASSSQYSRNTRAPSVSSTRSSNATVLQKVAVPEQPPYPRDASRTTSTFENRAEQPMAASPILQHLREYDRRNTSQSSPKTESSTDGRRQKAAHRPLIDVHLANDDFATAHISSPAYMPSYNRSESAMSMSTLGSAIRSSSLRPEAGIDSTFSSTASTDRSLRKARSTTAPLQEV